MRSLLVTLLGGLAFAIASPAQAVLNVLACEPEWGALVNEIAGDRARVFTATTAMQDPHRIEARPALIAQARRADLLVCTGAELEVGWLPLLQRESGNPKIQEGRPGYFEAALQVRLIEKPATVDRSMGDVHAAGNPHVHLDPRNLLAIAEALAKRLAMVDTANEAHYVERLHGFVDRFRSAMARWEREGAALRGVPVVVHHRSLSYLCNWLGLEVVADLEPKPGVEPSAAYTAQLLKQLQARPAALVLRTAYQAPRASDWIAGQTGTKAVVLPYTVGGSTRANDLFGLFDDSLSRLLDAVR